METATETQINPSKIMQIGMGFWASKTLLTAISMGLFTHLAHGELSGDEIKNKLGLHDRSLYDFLDTLVALGFLERSGLKETAMYSNAEDANLFLDKNKPSYAGGMLEMCNHRLYPFWNTLEDGLKTGLPQNETKNSDADIFDIFNANEPKLREFLKAMAGIQMGNFMMLANQFDFSSYSTLCDIGGAGGHLSAQIALNNPHMRCITFDTASVSAIAMENIEMMELADKVSIQAGDFIEGDIPSADVIAMGNILHDHGLQNKKMILKKAYNALPEGGVLMVIENIIDDNRRENAFGLMMSLNMLIETKEGFDFSFADFNEWAKDIGFKETSIMKLTGPTSAIIAIK